MNRISEVQLLEQGLAYYKRDAERERKRAEGLFNDKCTLEEKVRHLEAKLLVSKARK